MCLGLSLRAYNFSISRYNFSFSISQIFFGPVPRSDLKERFFRKDNSKGVTLSRPLGHFCKKNFFSGFRLKLSKKLSKVDRLEKKL